MSGPSVRIWTGPGIHAALTLGPREMAKLEGMIKYKSHSKIERPRPCGLHVNFITKIFQNFSTGISEKKMMLGPEQDLKTENLQPSIGP